MGNRGIGRARTRMTATALSLALAATMLGGGALAQSPPPAGPPQFHFTPGPRPATAPQEFPLYPGVAPGSETARQVESWAVLSVGGDSGGAVARNVTRPTFSVFKPAPGTATGAAVILAPGGGFLSLSMETEGWMAARWLAEHGVTAFVLKYRVNETAADPQAFMAQVGRMFATAARADAAQPPDITHDLATADGRAMVRLVRARAAEFGIDPHRVGFVGFSAGAMTALSVTLADAPGAAPDFVGLLYPPMTRVTPPADAPPLFVGLARNDGLFGHAGFGLVESWHAAKKPVEFHFYDGGDHGFGMRKLGTTSDHWIDEFYWWMQARGLLHG